MCKQFYPEFVGRFAGPIKVKIIFSVLAEQSKKKRTRKRMGNNSSLCCSGSSINQLFSTLRNNK